MTITVMSTTEAEEQTPATSRGAPKAEVTDKSAPELINSEQKEAAKSDAAETEAEENETDDTDSESEKDQDGTDAKDKPRKKGGFQRRIDKLNARYSAAQSEIEHWKSMALKSAGDKKEPEHVDDTDDTVKKADPAGKPIPDSFETHAEYVEALTDWKIEQRVKEAKEKEAKTRLETEQETLMKAHTDRVKTFATKTKDFQDVLESVDDVPVSPTIGELLVKSDNGPELMYELAKNREEFERINKLPPLAAARELGRIEARLSVKEETKQEPKKITKAPDPITPLGSKGGVVEKSIDDPNITQKEYEAIRAKQLAARKSAW